jgi:hypothetical protein
MLPMFTLLAVPALQALATPPSQPFAGLAFLEGRWAGEGAQAGSVGEFSLAKALDGKVLLRKNLFCMPGADGKAVTHEDLMVIFAEVGALRADYFDNEGHVIHYSVESGPDRATFLSAGPGPRFRLTYLRTGADTLEVRFEMAMPDKPEQFKVYQSGKVKRIGV